MRLTRIVALDEAACVAPLISHWKHVRGPLGLDTNVRVPVKYTVSDECIGFP